MFSSQSQTGTTRGLAESGHDQSGQLGSGWLHIKNKGSLPARTQQLYAPMTSSTLQLHTESTRDNFAKKEASIDGNHGESAYAEAGINDVKRTDANTMMNFYSGSMEQKGGVFSAEHLPRRSMLKTGHRTMYEVENLDPGNQPSVLKEQPIQEDHLNYTDGTQPNRGNKISESASENFLAHYAKEESAIHRDLLANKGSTSFINSQHDYILQE